jgi:uncharacterized protein with beta-barrel porin domain
MTPSLPTTNISTISTMNASLSTLKDHLAIKTKNDIKGNNLWIQSYNITAKQKNIDDKNGFSLDGNGFLIGYDTKIDTTSKYGVAFSYSTNSLTSLSSLVSENVSSKQEQLYLYFVKNFKNSYTQFYLAKGLDKNSGSREIYLGDINRKATSSYNSYLSNVTVTSGLKYKLSNFKIMPNISLSSSIFSTDVYREKGAGDLDLIVSNKDLYKSTLLIGSSFSAHKRFGSHIFLPELKVGYKQDFGDKYSQATAKFQNSLYTFKTEGIKMDDKMLTYGFALKYFNQSALIEGRFDFDKVESKHFNSTKLSLTLRYLFH